MAKRVEKRYLKLAAAEEEEAVMEWLERGAKKVIIRTIMSISVYILPTTYMYIITCLIIIITVNINFKGGIVQNSWTHSYMRF